MANFHVLAGPNKKKAVVQPTVRRITIADIFDALRRGLDDFWDKPSHYVFLCLIYPVVGVILITWSSGGNALQLIYPLATGFALLGPLAAIGLYEISRRRELNLDTSWTHALEVRNSPAIPAIVAVGVLLLALFVAWLLTAQALFNWLYGADVPASITAFVADVLTTERGWTLIILGNLAGFLFAVVVLSTVITFPLLLDRDVGARCRAPDVRSGHDCESDPDTAVGTDRRGRAFPGIAAAFRRPRYRHPGARPLYLASLPEGGRDPAGQEAARPALTSFSLLRPARSAPVIPALRSYPPVPKKFMRVRAV